MLVLAHPNIVAVLHKHETVETLSGGHQIEVGEIGMCERFFARDAIRWCVHEQILRPRKGGGSGAMSTVTASQAPVHETL